MAEGEERSRGGGEEQRGKRGRNTTKITGITGRPRLKRQTFNYYQFTESFNTGKLDFLGNFWKESSKKLSKEG